MSKDTPATPASPHQLLVHPATNMPIGVGYPFPVIHPPMGQFIPLGMVPIESKYNVQHYMEMATKSGFHPAMFAPMFGPSTVTSPNIPWNDSGNQSPNATDQTQNKDQVSGPLVSGPDYMSRTTSSSNINSKESDKTPVLPMPSMFFLPFCPSGFGGYFPNHPTFNVITASSRNTEILEQNSKPQQNISDEHEVLLASKSEEEKHSDELDVARILIDMQVPVLKQAQSSVAASGFNQDSIEAKMSNESASSEDAITSPSIPADVYPSCHSGLDGPVRHVNTPSPFPHCSDQMQIDEQLEELRSHSNDFVMNEIDEQNGEDVNLKVSLDAKNDNVGLEEPSGVKLEVLSEGESTQPAQCMEILDLEQPPMPVSNNVKIVDMPCNLLDERPGETAEGQHPLELKSIKSEVLDVSSFPAAESTVASKESSKLLTSDAITVSCDHEQIDAAPESKSALKQEFPEERKDEDDLEKNESGGDENGVPKKVYKCDVCSQLFRSPLGLQKHIEFHMDDGKHYTCTICFMHFCNDNALQEHNEKHMRKRPHKCEFCPKAFRDPGSLQKHVRVHTGEKPYKCKDCPRSFAEYSSLRKHQRVHTGEQPYKCQYCSKAFSISGNLQRHILIHTGERPYKCNFCTKAFNNPSHLRRHVKNLHFKGDAAIDEAMLSHYGNPTATKTAESEASPEIKGEAAMKQLETQQVNCIGPHLVNTGGVELASRNDVVL